MAAGPVQVYHKGLLKIANQTVDLVNDTIVALLLDTAHTVDLANHEFITDVVANECGDGDYTRQTLSGKTITLVGGKIRFDCADLDFGNAVTISARYLVIAKNTGSDATSSLVMICDLNTGGGNLSSTASDFDAAINASGLYEITPNV